MKHSKLIVSAAAAVSAMLGIGAASAADLPARTYTKAPPMAPVMVSNWSGCYIGGNIGYGWQRTTSTDAQPGTLPPLDAGTETGTGAVGGGQVGCDYQFASNWVVGVQGMFDGAAINGSHLAPFVYAGTNTLTFTTKTNWFGTLTARIGYAVTSQALLYFKGGAAWVNSDYTDADPSGKIFVPYSGQASTTGPVGPSAAVENSSLSPNWSVFAEYNCIDLGSKTLANTYNCGAVCGFANPYLYSEKQNLQTVLVRLNYRWGGPLVARY